jgi:DNA-binding response OmpR family regulator
MSDGGAREERNARAMESPPAPHVLIVEDSELMSDALRLLFEASGYRVTIADSVSAAVRSGTEQGVDAMLLDLTLPDGDGLLALDALKRAERTPRVTYALTGRDDTPTRLRCLAAGCEEVLVKPVPWRELVTRVATRLAQE